MCHAAVRVNSISIHSLHTEGDAYGTISEPRDVISIHSLRMEGDGTLASAVCGKVAFQSTPSAWRETSS